MMEEVLTCPACGKGNRTRASTAGTPHCGACSAPLPWLVEAATAAQFAEVAERSPLPVLVDFWAPWCGPCRMVAPTVLEASVKFAGRLKVVKLNTDLAPDVSGRYGVQGIPTLVVLKNGAVADRVTGALPASQLHAWLERTLAR